MATLTESSCLDHGKRVEMFDKQCRRLVCAECSAEHKGHELQKIPEAARDCRRGLDSLVEQTKGKLPRFQEQQALLGKQAEQLQQSYQQALQHLKTAFKEIRKAVDARETELTKQLSDGFTKSSSKVSEQSEQLKNLLSKIGTVEQRAKQAKQDISLLLLQTEIQNHLAFKHPQAISLPTFGFVDNANLVKDVERFASIQISNSQVAADGKISPQPNHPSHRGEFVRAWGAKGSQAGQFANPYGVAVSDTGEVYVTDYNNHNLQVCRADGAFIRGWGEHGEAEGQFESPGGVVVANGEVYVCDYNAHRVQVFTTAGKFLRYFSSDDESFPEYIQVSSGEIFVTDNADQVQVFKPDGRFLRMWGSTGRNAGQFRSPRGVAVHGGEVFVSDMANHRIQVFRLDGAFLRMWGSSGEKPGEFNSPYGIVVSELGEVFVADKDNHRIQVFRRDGSLTRVLGSRGTGPGQFQEPKGIALTRAGEIVVTDAGNCRVQVFR